MRSHFFQHSRPSEQFVRSLRTSAGVAVALTGALALLLATQSAQAIGTAVDLGTAGSYSVLGGQSVTNTGSSVLSSDLGVNPGTAISGFPPGILLAGASVHAGDSEALQAQSDLTIAYDDAAGQAPDSDIADDIGGRTLTPGVYKAPSSILITGPLTLDAQGDPNAVFIFQIGSSLTTASGSSVVLVNGAQSCNVFWQVTSSATLGTDTSFVGTIMALTSITANTGTTVEGRALARNGSVSLDTNTFSDVKCDTTTPASPTPTTSASPTPTTSVSPTPTTSVSPTPTTSTDVTPTPSDTSPTQSSPATPTASRSRATVPANGGGTPSGGSLADTGASPTGPLLAVAAASILVGIILFVSGRRHSRRSGV